VATGGVLVLLAGCTSSAPSDRGARASNPVAVVAPSPAGASAASGWSLPVEPGSRSPRACRWSSGRRGRRPRCVLVSVCRAVLAPARRTDHRSVRAFGDGSRESQPRSVPARSSTRCRAARWSPA